MPEPRSRLHEALRERATMEIQVIEGGEGYVRVIAGRIGGRPLMSVPGKGTRPTSSRVKEALFSRLESLGVLDGARVLDLYAGSAALAVECASRGSARIDSVEVASGAARVARANAALTRDAESEPVVVVHRERVETFLERSREDGRVWDIVLADPPYDLSQVALGRVLQLLVPVCTPGALVVIERDRRCPEPGWPAGLHGSEARGYGDTRLWFGEVVVGPSENQHSRPAAAETVG